MRGSPQTDAGHRRHRRPTSIPPRWIVAVACATGAFFALPFAGLVARTPWAGAWSIATSDASLTALRLSLLCSLAAAGLSVLFGVPLAWTLASARFPGRSAVLALCTVSMVLPPVVGGVALLFALGRRGVVGRFLFDWFGVQIPFSTAAVVIAQSFVAMPFLVVTVESALRNRDTSTEDAARTLGAGAWTTFRRVTLPAIKPALVAGTVLAWARALGEFGATITFAGSLPGVTRTMPLAVYTALETDPDAALVQASAMIAISLLVLVGLRDRWWLGARTGGGA